MSIKTVNIMLVDDHEIVRYGFKSLLEGNRDFKIVGEADHGRQALSILEGLHKKVDVLLSDVSMEKMDGVELAREVTKRYPDIAILALTMHQESHIIRSMLEAGVSGYILKNSGKDELIEAIYTVAGGETYYCGDIAKIVLDKLSRRESKDTSDAVPFSKRELEILKLIIKEKSNQEIADELYLSIRTVEAHKYNLIEKANARNIVGLIKYAIEHELV